MAFDSTDRVHVAWQDDSSGNLDIYYKNSADFGQTWSPLKRLTWTEYTSAQPTIAVDSNNSIHLAYYEQTTYSTEIFYRRSTDGGSSWSPPSRLTYTPGTSAQPDMVIDSSNVIHLIYLDDSNPLDVTEIFYTSSSNGGVTWSAPLRLTYTLDYSLLPALAVDAGDNLHLVWRESSPGNWEIFYKYMSQATKNWTPAKRITWTSTPSNVPDVCADSNNKVHIVWLDDAAGGDDLYYKSSTNGGTTWSSTRRLTWNGKANETPNIVAGSPQTLHLAWYVYMTSTNADIFYRESTDGGATWTAASRLTWNSSWSGYPKMALDNMGKPSMVWEEYITDQYDIFYRHQY